MKIHSTPIKRTFAALAVIAAARLWAQTDPNAAPQTPETVVLPSFAVNDTTDKGYLAGNSVSATRINMPIADLPFSISAFTGQFIQDTGALDLYDIVSYAAGVRSASDEFLSGNTSFAIRGFVQTPEHDGFFESSQGNTYVDPANIERVEVVKGPASLLYGGIAPGGTVNYITKRPEDKAFIDLAFSEGSYNYNRETLDVNQPLIPHVLLFRLNAAWENGYEWVDYSYARDLVLDPTITWKITKNLSLKSSYQGFERHSNVSTQVGALDVATPQSIVNAFNPALGYPGSAALLANKTSAEDIAGYQDGLDLGAMSQASAYPKRFNYEGANDWYIAHLQTISEEADLTLGDHWAVRANYDYNANENKQIYTGISTYYSAPPGSLTYSAASKTWSVSPSWTALSAAQQIQQGVAYASVLANYSQAEYSAGQPVIDNRRQRFQETYGHTDALQAEASGDYEFSWAKIKPLVGVFYDASYLFSQTFGNAGNAASPYFQPWDINPESPTYYVNPFTSFTPNQLTTHSADSLSFTTDEAAYAIVNSSFLNDRMFLTFGGRYNITRVEFDNFLSTAGPTSARFIHMTPEVALGFKVTKDLMLYASYSTSYSAPSTAFTTTIGTVNGVAASIPSGTARPITGTGYEVGAKSNFLSGRVSSTLSAYQIDESNVIQSVGQIIGGSTVLATFQGTEVRSKGIEYEITWSPLDNWQVVASATEDDVRYVAEPVGYQVYLGTHPWFTGKTMANIWTRYSFAYGPLKGLWVGAGVQYTGPSVDVANDPYYLMPGFVNWNSAAGYDWMWQQRHFSLVAHWENMSNSPDYITGYERGLPSRVSATLTLHF